MYFANLIDQFSKSPGAMLSALHALRHVYPACPVKFPIYFTGAYPVKSENHLTGVKSFQAI
jgi:hypothetical protein